MGTAENCGPVPVQEITRVRARIKAAAPPGQSLVAKALTECAWAAANKKGCLLDEKFWGISIKHGGKKASAVVAVSHFLPILVYQVLCTGQRH